MSEKINYVLDTNVLLHDPAALFRFEEHNIIIPFAVLEELDKHKKGETDLARNARVATRSLGELLSGVGLQALQAYSLEEASGGSATGTLSFVNEPADWRTPELSGLDRTRMDNKILATIIAFKEQGRTILVSKDINLRVKAIARGLAVQDYRSDRSLQDSDVLSTGFETVGPEFWDKSPSSAGRDMELEISNPINSFVVDADSRVFRVCKGSTDTRRHLKPITNKLASGALLARNDEQSMALELLLDPSVDFVALLGKAGSGKTLLALAAGMEQVRYKQIILTRATVPVGDDIGFLPGTEEEKMSAWLGGTIEDCVEVLKLTEEAQKRIKIASMSFMRGRSFHNRYIIVDEAQNLTPLQVRTMLTRVGVGTKIVLTGNLAQIDSPFLDAGSSGLTWAVKNIANTSLGGHIIIPRGERSALASYVEDLPVTKK